MKNKTKKFAHLKIYLKIFYFSSFLSYLPYVLTKNEKWFPNFQQKRQFLFFLLSNLFFSSKKIWLAKSSWISGIRFFWKDVVNSSNLKSTLLKVICVYFEQSKKRPCFLVKKLQNAVRQKIKLIYFNRLLVSIDVRVKTLMKFFYS